MVLAARVRILAKPNCPVGDVACITWPYPKPLLCPNPTFRRLYLKMQWFLGVSSRVLLIDHQDFYIINKKSLFRTQPIISVASQDIVAREQGVSE